VPPLNRAKFWPFGHSSYSILRVNQSRGDNSPGNEREVIMFCLAWQLAGVLLAAAVLGREKQTKKSKVEQEQD
jgi:hypothetical protein